jgi:hypothetical protein
MLQTKTMGIKKKINMLQQRIYIIQLRVLKMQLNASKKMFRSISNCTKQCAARITV